MNQTQKKFIWYAVGAVFVLLAVLLGVLNAISFTMAAEDADAITQQIADGQGTFGPRNGGPEGFQLPEGGQLPEGFQPAAGQNPQGGPDFSQGPEGFQGGPFNPFGGMGPMGLDSPELNDTMRYFTAVFDENGKGSLVSYNISAVTQEEALEWAASLRQESTGWTQGTYRYRVYQQNGQLFVTVVDLGRELLSAYRILLFSLFGLVVFTALSFLILRLVGRKLFAPIEDADRKQKQFIAEAEQELKLPLTVISADTEILERTHGPSEQTRSIHNQVRNMNSLVRRLGSLAIYEDTKLTKATFPLSELVQELADQAEDRFARQNLAFTADITPGITLTGSPEAMEQAVTELLDNGLKFARSRFSLTLDREGGRIRLTAVNDTQLPEGPADQCFDRFTVLSNAPAGSVGLGLAGVRDKVLALGGRVSAKVENGEFKLRLNL